MYFRTGVTAFAAALIAALPAFAEYPERNVTLVVPFGAGASIDAAARYFAELLREELGTTVIVENRGGAGSAIGTEYVARAENDGYTLLFTTSSSVSVVPAVQSNVQYDPLVDFDPIFGMFSGGSVLQINSSVPADTLEEFIAYAKERPGELSYGSAGIGTIPHVAGEIFQADTGIEMVHVPYPSGGDAAIDLIAGHIQVLLGPTGTVAQNLASGEVKALVSMAPQRPVELPDMPTVAELGHPNLEQPTAWFGLFAPAGVSQEVHDRLVAASEAIFSDPEVAEYVVRFGLRADSLMVGDSLRRLMASDLEAYRAIAEERNIRTE